jgi:hypothetical protein
MPRVSRLLDLGAVDTAILWFGLSTRRLCLNFLRITAALHDRPLPTYMDSRLLGAGSAEDLLDVVLD